MIMIVTIVIATTMTADLFSVEAEELVQFVYQWSQKLESFVIKLPS